MWTHRYHILLRGERTGKGVADHQKDADQTGRVGGKLNRWQETHKLKVLCGKSRCGESQDQACECEVRGGCIPTWAEEVYFWPKSKPNNAVSSPRMFQYILIKKMLLAFVWIKFFFLTGQAHCYHLLRNRLCQYLITVHPHGLWKSVWLWDIVACSCL